MQENSINYEELSRQAEEGTYETDTDAQEFYGAEARAELRKFLSSHS